MPLISCAFGEPFYLCPRLFLHQDKVAEQLDLCSALGGVGRGKGTRIPSRVRTFIMITFICKVATDKPCAGDTFFPACLASQSWTNDGENDLRARGKGNTG